MPRKILIIDDHDDLATALEAEFSKLGHEVSVIKSRLEALAVEQMEGFDLVIMDLDSEKMASAVEKNGSGADGIECLPSVPSESEHIKAFKICATSFSHIEHDENELKTLIETTLNYKAEFVDQRDAVQSLREKIEFELPSVIGLMHSILDYLIKRVEKVGIIDSQTSNLFIALDEAFVNAVKHGNKFDASKNIKIAAEVSAKEARFTIEDEGEGFDVNAIPDPCDPENLFKSSGRGVLFIYNIMDEVEYNERGNRLTMVKKKNDLYQESKQEIS